MANFENEKNRRNKKGDEVKPTVPDRVVPFSSASIAKYVRENHPETQMKRELEPLRFLLRTVVAKK